jgi:thioredoxin reductase (NADPH)
MPSQDERNEHAAPANAVSPGAAGSRTPLASRYQQMFPVLSAAEIDRVRRFGDVRRFPDGELLFQAGDAVQGMYVILSGRVAIVTRDGLGRSASVADFAHLIGVPVEEMEQVLPGEVVGEIGQLSGRTDLSLFDARAVGDVEAIVVAPEALRTLLVAEAELGERILRALILRRVALIEIGFGGPVLIGKRKSTEVTRLTSFLERNGIPLRWSIPKRTPMARRSLRASPRSREISRSQSCRTARCSGIRPSKRWRWPSGWWRRTSAPKPTTW